MADVFGLPPYGCQRRLWYEKRGVAADYPDLGNEHMARGIFFEPIVARLYQKTTGNELMKPRTLRDKVYPFIMGHPDRLHKKDGAPLEIKCPSRRNFRTAKMEGLRDEYILQIQHYIHLCNAAHGTMTIFCAETAELLYFEVERKDDLIKTIIEAEKEFWNKVLEATEPSRLDPTDRRCGICTHRTTCQGEALPSIAQDKTILQSDPSLAGLVNEYFKAKEIASEAEDYLEETKEEIRLAMGERVAIETAGAKIYYKPITSYRWDTKTLETKHPELVQEFSKKTVSRPLRVYPI